jgi:dTDP-4-amino-4,6-dideoxygalactose transaminase
MIEQRIPIMRPWMDEREAEAARRAILSGWVTQGAEVAAFEAEFAEMVGAAHACAVSSCTTALHLALQAVGVGPGDEVVTASHSYVATANAVRYCGAVPVFADIEPDSPNLDPERVEASLSPKTKAILCVHQMGMPCDLDCLSKIASRHSLPLIEDAACAIGSAVRIGSSDLEWIGRPQGDIACFSFHPRKLLTTGEGGMLTTRHAELDRRFRRERQHGMSVPDLARHSAARVIEEQHLSLGYNYRMTDIQAAIGRVQLTRLPEILERRRYLAARYFSLLASLPVSLPCVPEWAQPNWQSFWVRLPESCDRPELMQHMLDAGVATRRGILCAHREPVYRSEPWRSGAGGLAASEQAQDHSLLLPLFHQMTEAEQEQVVSALSNALAAQKILYR